MAEFFEVGDKVILNSGGPIMTVTSVDTKFFSDTRKVYTEWLLAETTVQRANFPRACLSLLVREEIE